MRCAGALHRERNRRSPEALAVALRAPIPPQGQQLPPPCGGSTPAAPKSKDRQATPLPVLTSSPTPSEKERHSRPNSLGRASSKERHNSRAALPVSKGPEQAEFSDVIAAPIAPNCAKGLTLLHPAKFCQNMGEPRFGIGRLQHHPSAIVFGAFKEMVASAGLRAASLAVGISVPLHLVPAHWDHGTVGPETVDDGRCPALSLVPLPPSNFRSIYMDSGQIGAAELPWPPSCTTSMMVWKTALLLTFPEKDSSGDRERGRTCISDFSDASPILALWNPVTDSTFKNKLVFTSLHNEETMDRVEGIDEYDKIVLNASYDERLVYDWFTSEKPLGEYLKTFFPVFRKVEFAGSQVQINGILTLYYGTNAKMLDPLAAGDCNPMVAEDWAMIMAHYLLYSADQAFAYKLERAFERLSAVRQREFLYKAHVAVKRMTKKDVAFRNVTEFINFVLRRDDYRLMNVVLTDSKIGL
ncbi:hypothetical protein ISCGN_027889 [Ixodes scapularis]